MTDLSGVITKLTDGLMDTIRGSVDMSTIRETLEKITTGGYRGDSGLKQGDGENSIWEPDCGDFVRGGRDGGSLAGP